MRAPSNGNCSAIPSTDAPGIACSADSSNRVAVSSSASALSACTGKTRLVEREHHIRGAATRELQAVAGAYQVRLHHVVGTAVEAGERRRLSRALEQRIELIKGEEIVEHADIAVHERDARVSQSLKVELGPSPAQVVEGRYLPSGMALREADRDVGADEARASGYQ